MRHFSATDSFYDLYGRPIKLGRTGQIGMIQYGGREGGWIIFKFEGDPIEKFTILRDGFDFEFV
jgi:hypothetical protein